MPSNTTEKTTDNTTAAECILSLTGISKIYPGTVALQDVTLEITRGETHGIIGKNGAGKTTLVGIVAGLIRPSAGTFRINGHGYARLTRIGARSAGVAIVPQEPQLVQEATVAENLFMPEYVRRGGGALVDWPAMHRAASDILRSAGLAIDPRSKAADLGIGLQQILLMIKASYVERAEIIILDEAFASLSQREEQLFYRLIRERKQQGCTILHISHRIDELLEVCDRMTVLRDGHSICTVERNEVDHNSLASLIVGENSTLNEDENAYLHSTSDSEQPATQEALLQVEGLTIAERIFDVGFTVRRNEILGIAGLIGSGRSTVLRSIFGLEALDEGRIVLGGTAFTPESPANSLRRGVVYLPEERDEEGLVTSLAVRSNLVLSALQRVSGRLLIDRSRETALAGSLAKQLALHFASFDQEVSELSGGNRQKVVVGKVLSTQPEVFLLDEPTKGIDIAAKATLLRIIREELRPNSAIVMSTPGLEDLISICDRIIVLHNGRVLDEFTSSEFNEERLYKAIQGNLGET